MVAMADLVVTTRIATRRARRATKYVQRVLGPQVATPMNAAAAVILLQFFCIFALGTGIRERNRALRNALWTSRELPEFMRAPTDRTTSRIAPWTPAVFDDANYDDMSLTNAGLVEVSTGADFFTPFLTCKPRPCEIDHWTRLEEMCFLTDTHVKERFSHNVTTSSWVMIRNDTVYSTDTDYPCPTHICRRHWQNELAVSELMVQDVLKEHYENNTEWRLQGLRSNTVYTRVNPYWGLEYKINGILNLARDRSAVVEEKSATVTLRRGFTQKFCDVSLNVDLSPADKPVYVVVPYSNRVEELRAFYINIKKLMDEGVNLRIVLSTFGTSDVVGVSELLHEMQIGLTTGPLSDGHVIQVVQAEGDLQGKFSRSLALLEGTKHVPDDGLIFFCDVDMAIEKEFFDNCRHNTERRFQVYFPIVYSLYPYGHVVSREHGYWRAGAFGMVCVFKGDLDAVKKKWNHKQLVKINGWGLDDVVLKREFDRHWKISVLHAVEPNLMHKWHPKRCELNMNIVACPGTVLLDMGSQQFLASVVASKGIDVRDIPYEPTPLVYDHYSNATDPESNDRLLNVPIADGETDEAKYNDFRASLEHAVRTAPYRLDLGRLAVLSKEAQDELLTKARAMFHL